MGSTWPYSSNAGPGWHAAAACIAMPDSCSSTSWRNRLQEHRDCDRLTHADKGLAGVKDLTPAPVGMPWCLPPGLGAASVCCGWLYVAVQVVHTIWQHTVASVRISVQHFDFNPFDKITAVYTATKCALCSSRLLLLHYLSTQHLSCITVAAQQGGASGHQFDTAGPHKSLACTAGCSSSSQQGVSSVRYVSPTPLPPHQCSEPGATQQS